MFFKRKKNRDEHRFYLLPGMGRSNRHHHRRTFHWALIVGVLASVGIAALLYFLNSP